MAKRRKGKRKGSRRKGRKSKGRAIPKTVGGVWRAQPLLVKGGMALSAIEIGTVQSAHGAPLTVASAVLKKQAQLNQLGEAIKDNAMNLGNYKPLAYGVIAHYVAKKLRIKGL